MLRLSFKNRIAFNYIVSTALLIFVVFIVIHHIVEISVYSQINADITEEVKKHSTEITVKNHQIQLIHDEEWKEREHNTFNVNPVFIEFVDAKGNIIEKSPNLKDKKLSLTVLKKDNEFFDTFLDGKIVRQIQVPVFEKNTKVGYSIVAMSLEDATMVLKSLQDILLVAFPLILFLLFFIARFIAGRSIKPVSAIIEMSSEITKDNLSSRIELPKNKDELYQLSKNINELLDRIESAVEREKQFTSDASHELRTPLAVIKGTLEVLIRKPREKEEYENKINCCISEVDRLNSLVDELLLLARFENQKQFIKQEDVLLNSTLLDVIARFSTKLQTKNIVVSTDFQKDYYVKTDSYLLSIIIGNLISNAINYTPANGSIFLSISSTGNKTICKITDTGIGIKKEDISKIFEQFYRSDASEHSEIKGTGLGLSIVEKLCLLLSIEIDIKSNLKEGTEVILNFQ